MLEKNMAHVTQWNRDECFCYGYAYFMCFTKVKLVFACKRLVVIQIVFMYFMLK